jgi:hypothetical protein
MRNSGLQQVYGMDAASGAAVEALDLSPGDHVLDLCAAPGSPLNPAYVTGNSSSFHVTQFS